MVVKTFVVSEFMSNCYVLAASNAPGADAVIIDPGSHHLDPVFNYIDTAQLSLKAMWNTHAHLDHVEGVDLVRDRYNIPAYVHRLDEPVWNSIAAQGARWLNREVAALRAPDEWLEEGDILELAGHRFVVWHTPGHSPGSVCFVNEAITFTGDTLMHGTMGRVDLPLSDPEAMTQSMRRMTQLPETAMLYPGHMEPTTLAEERHHNRYLPQS